jgi:hypothetical protein
MPALDIFNDDAFSVSSLTAAIINTPHLPSRISGMGIFQEEGITTTTVQIEREGRGLNLVTAGERGQPAAVVAGDKRAMIPFNTQHLPQRATILADEIQNVRSFGSESELETVQSVVNKRLAKMRRNIDATLEYHRLGAIKGQILDANGSTVLLDLFTAFGITQNTHSMALANSATKIRNKIVEAKRKVEDELGGLSYTGLTAICGAGFFDALLAHEDAKAAFDRWQDGAFLREDLRNGFPWAGVVWEEYRGKVGGVDFVGANDAYLIPTGVADMYLTRFAPADYMETANTIGLPYYAKPELMGFNKGVMLEAQSNPLCINTRPRAVLKMTAA